MGVSIAVRRKCNHSDRMDSSTLRFRSTTEEESSRRVVGGAMVSFEMIQSHCDAADSSHGSRVTASPLATPPSCGEVRRGTGDEPAPTDDLTAVFPIRCLRRDPRSDALDVGMCSRYRR
jgi:hypothetical protein